MSTLTEVQRAALELSDDERALLMARLWESLADSNVEGDIVEQRLKELANDPASEISHDEFIAEVQKARSSGR